MDPYLEDPQFWPDLHHALAITLRDELNRCLPEPYYARTEMRPELGVVMETDGNGDAPRGATKRIIPDVMVLKHHREGGGVAVAEPARRLISHYVEFGVPGLGDEPVRHYYVEIKDARWGHKLVTLIEILSPSNKLPGPDRDLYAEKQRAILHSDVSLIEIDLLRTGRRVYPSPALEEEVGRLDPPPTYLVMVSPAWRRMAPMWGYRGYPFTLREPLPCIAVPLRQGVEDVLLDLQIAFDRAYDGGPYRRAVDYGKPPGVPLAPGAAAWAERLLRERRAP
jgi:hypothetical protein